jgi:hypothetical protein
MHAFPISTSRSDWMVDAMHAFAQLRAAIGLQHRVSFFSHLLLIREASLSIRTITGLAMKGAAAIPTRKKNFFVRFEPKKG